MGKKSQSSGGGVSSANQPRSEREKATTPPKTSHAASGETSSRTRPVVTRLLHRARIAVEFALTRRIVQSDIRSA